MKRDETKISLVDLWQFWNIGNITISSKYEIHGGSFLTCDLGSISKAIKRSIRVASFFNLKPKAKFKWSYKGDLLYYASIYYPWYIQYWLLLLGSGFQTRCLSTTCNIRCQNTKSYVVLCSASRYVLTWDLNITNIIWN